MAHTRYDLRSVLLDLLTAPAPVATLTAPQVGRNVVLAKSQASREAFDDDR
jgi:hypothetical protein